MTRQTELRDAYRYCDRYARRKARHFYPAFRFLRRDRRLALSAFYAFCSLSDDISDDDDSSEVRTRRQRLDLWRRKLDDCFSGGSSEPVFLALSDAIRRFHLPRQPFYDLLDGVEMDLFPRRYETFDQLLEYCRRVASSVGRVSVRIFGCDHPGAEAYADHLGVAFQLTNILRDVAEDLDRRRIYLPAEDLDRFSYPAADLEMRIYDDRFLALMDFQYNRARDFYRKADPNLAGDQRRRLRTAEIMKSAYRNLLEELKRRRFRVFEERVRLPARRLASGTIRALLRSGLR
jgi:phytoene synthase